MISANNRPQIKEKTKMREKTSFFHMRMSEETKAKLESLAKRYNLTASAVVDMLIAKADRKEKGEK